MLSHTSRGTESGPCGLSEEGEDSPIGEKLALRAEVAGAGKLAMSTAERTESKSSIATVASRDSECWACMSIAPISIEFVARAQRASQERLCPAHQVEVAAVLLKWVEPSQSDKLVDKLVARWNR